MSLTTAASLLLCTTPKLHLCVVPRFHLLRVRLRTNRSCPLGVGRSESALPATKGAFVVIPLSLGAGYKQLLAFRASADSLHVSLNDQSCAQPKHVWPVGFVLHG